MSGTRDLAADVDIDVAGLLAEVWKKRWLVAVLTLVAGAAIFAVTLYVEPRYDASARILVEKRESVFTRPSASDGVQDDNRFDEQAIGSQVQVLTSDDIALKVITALGLDRTTEFSGGGSALGNILSLFGLNSEPSGVSAAERSLATFRKHLTVYAADKSRVLVVEFWSRDPELAQAVPNAIADEYLKLTKQAKIESNTEATQWLGPEIDDLRTKVRDAEAKVAAFRANSDILDGTNNSPLITQQLSEVSSQVSQLRAQRAAAEAKAASIRAALDNGASLDTIPEVLASPLIQRLRERQVSLQAEISDLSTSLLPSHPRLRALRSQLGDFERQIRAEASNILKGLQNNADVLRDQENGLMRDLDRMKAEAARAGEAAVELRALEREATAQRDLLQTYLTQYREAASRQNREYLPVDARIISRAVRPAEPYFPKILPMVASAMVGMLVLAVTGILAWALMTGRAFRPVVLPIDERMPERLEVPEAPLAPELPADDDWRPSWQSDDDDVTSAPATADAAAPTGEEGDLPSVNAPSLEPEHRVSSLLDQKLDEAPASGIERFGFRHACEAIENLGSGRIVVASPAGDPGSLTVWLLARHLAGRGLSVAVVDLTGSGVTGREMLGEGAFTGLRELLGGEARFAEAVHRDRRSSAHVLPAGDASREVTIDRLPDIVDAVRDSHDFQIYDCGYAGAEALKLVSDKDTIILLSAEGAAPAEIDEMVEELALAGLTETILVDLDAEDREVALAGAA